MRVIGNKQLEEMDAEEANLAEEAKINETSISAYIMDCWTKAKNFKEQGAELQILANMRQIDGRYEDDKLAAIKKVGGSEVFMMITDAKCKNARDWTNEILFQTGNKPFGVTPSPIPELPEFVREEIAERALRSVIESVAMQAPQILQDTQALQQIMEQAMPQIEEEVKVGVMTEAKKISEQLEKEIDDKLTEGSWYEAMREVVKNVVMHTGILKGPVLKKRKLQKVVTTNDGRMSTQVVEDIIPTYESRHPLYIYPAPGSTDVNDGYMFDRIKVTPMKLQELIGVPGYDKEELLAVISESSDGKLRNWLNLQVDQDISALNEEISTVAYDSDKIDCLEFWGYVYGEKIIEWGLTKNGEEVIDPNLYYNVCAYLINDHVIKVNTNTDPLGRKPFYRASFEEREGSFWGKGLPEIITDCQQTCNAAARAIVNNAGMGSGPQVERNIDRIPAAAREDNALIPWKVWDVTDSMMVNNSPAIKFYQPPMVVERLMGVYTSFSKIADEHSGVPAFAHGDPQVGGAGNTASGLSMLMSSSARGIKALVGTIDRNVTAPSVLRQYHMLIEQGNAFGLICDYNVVTLGSTAAVQKEQLAARRMEFMQNTANPIDMQIIGLDGRKYMLEETAQSLQFDMNRLFPPQAPPMPPPGEGNPNAGGAGEPATKGRELDAAGNPVSGTDNRTTGGRGGDGGSPIQRRAEGGPVEADQPYIVGERGPEVIVPDTNGEVIPNNRLVDTVINPSTFGGYNAPRIAPNIGNVEQVLGREEETHPLAQGRTSMTPRETWEARPERVHEITNEALRLHGGDVSRALDYIMDARKANPHDVGIAGSEYLLYGYEQSKRGQPAVVAEALNKGYDIAKRVLPESIVKAVVGGTARGTTPLAGQAGWYTQGRKWAEEGLTGNDISNIHSILGIQPSDLRREAIPTNIGRDIMDTVSGYAGKAYDYLKDEVGSGYAGNVANLIRKRSKNINSID